MNGNEKIEVSLTFYTEAEGGRTDGNPASLVGNIYRPHLVVEDPKNRKPTAGENYIGVMFDGGPDRAMPGKEHIATALVLFQHRELLQPGATFTIREGQKVVGYGKVKRWMPSSTDTPL